jgi:hypothetical protein
MPLPRYQFRPIPKQFLFQLFTSQFEYVGPRKGCKPSGASFYPSLLDDPEVNVILRLVAPFPFVVLDRAAQAVQSIFFQDGVSVECGDNRNRIRRPRLLRKPRGEILASTDLHHVDCFQELEHQAAHWRIRLSSWAEPERPFSYRIGPI